MMEPGRPTLYGGQVAAQALMAAGLTVPEGRVPHSLHGYFLRPGIPDVPVNLQVHRDRDGRSFSARHVAAVQDGEVIFSMLTSFHTGAEGVEIDDVDATPMPPPEECVEWPSRMPVDMVQVTEHEFTDAQKYSDTFWVQSSHPLPDDPLVHVVRADLHVRHRHRVRPDPERRDRLRRPEHRPRDVVPAPASGPTTGCWCTSGRRRRSPGGRRTTGRCATASGRLGAMLVQEHLLIAQPHMDMRTWPADWKEQMR